MTPGLLPSSLTWLEKHTTTQLSFKLNTLCMLIGLSLFLSVPPTLYPFLPPQPPHLLARNLMSWEARLLQSDALQGGIPWASMWVLMSAWNLFLAKECQWVGPTHGASRGIWEVCLPRKGLFRIRLQWQEGFLTSFLPSLPPSLRLCQGKSNPQMSTESIPGRKSVACI